MKDKPPKKYFTYTYGCQMNEHDSQVIGGLLEEAGFHPAQRPEEAALILLNTCCVREKAENRVYGRLAELRKLKRGRPGLVIAVAGCMAQQEEAAARIRKEAPQVDILLGTHELHRLPELVGKVEATRKSQTALSRVAEIRPEHLPIKRADRIKAQVVISFGCNNFCTYCVVPFVRGPEMSRRQEDVLAEVRSLAEQGYKEVMLLGQNVNTYGRDLSGEATFGGLLKLVDKIDDLARIRFTTSHPRDFDPELVDVIAGSKRICEHFHLPAQSGSNRILQLMHRGYSRERYLALVDTIRRRIPGAAITTDLIVGFPGETEEDFADTLDLMERVRFDAAFTFLYSPRSGTVAATLPEQVPDGLKRERFARLNELQNSLSRESNERLRNRMVELLVEGKSKTNPERLSGRTRTNKIVIFPGSEELIGRLVNLRVTEVHTFNLFGEIDGGEAS